MQDLQGDFTAFFVNGIGHNAMRCGSCDASLSTARFSIPTPDGAGATPGDDWRHPVAGAFGIKAARRSAPSDAFQPGMH